jgi:hypothetical protein
VPNRPPRYRNWRCHIPHDNSGVFHAAILGRLTCFRSCNSISTRRNVMAKALYITLAAFAFVYVLIVISGIHP